MAYTPAINMALLESENEQLRQRVAELEEDRDALRIQCNFGKSKDIHSLAEIILTDCGCSVEHDRLLDKVENRLWTYFDEQYVTLTAERDALKQQRDELLAALDGLINDTIKGHANGWGTLGAYYVRRVCESTIASVKEKTWKSG